MPLQPLNNEHAMQINAGTRGRRSGHRFEAVLSDRINNMKYPLIFESSMLNAHVTTGDPSYLLLRFIANTFGYTKIRSVKAFATGSLATSETGADEDIVRAIDISRTKSDIVVFARFDDDDEKTIGVSTKQCNNRTPTNAQLFFTTATGFCSLLRDHGIDVSDCALEGLRRFCGDAGFTPVDILGTSSIGNRSVDPRRFFWEELPECAYSEWERLFSNRQDDITRILLQKGYAEDRFPPDFLLHKTKSSVRWDDTEVAIYTIEELIEYSRKFGGYWLKQYSVRKGQYKDPTGVTHQAPRFGIVQMQRGGQRQHPTQLQFNLAARYFNHIQQHRSDVLGDLES